MYKYTRGLREWTLDMDSFSKDFLNKCKIFNINSRDVKFYSQQDEDKYIIQYLLKEKIDDGTFLEIGACDGVFYTNTKTLEDHFGFSGIFLFIPRTISLLESYIGSSQISPLCIFASSHKTSTIVPGPYILLLI